MSDPLREAAARLRDAGIDSPRAEARMLWECAQRSAGGAERFESLIARRIAREPVAYITGHKEFWSLDFEVGSGVLIPRPETETLIEQALREFPERDAPLDVLDFGTGSGAILIAFLTERPNAQGLGIEQSAEAMRWAKANLARHGLEARCRLQGGDWAQSERGEFDVIFSNPPYIPNEEIARLEPDVAQYEPRAALDGGPDGLDAYRALAPQIAARLKPGGRAFLEIGQGQGVAVPEILAKAGLETLRIAPDLTGIPRCIVAIRPEKNLGMGGATR